MTNLTPDREQNKNTNTVNLEEQITASFQNDLPSSSEDSEEDNYGYELLPTNNEQMSASITEENDSICNSIEEDKNNLLQSSLQCSNLNEDLIKQTMKNIKLPETNIPLWANEITDEEWKTVVQKTVTKN